MNEPHFSVQKDDLHITGYIDEPQPVSPNLGTYVFHNICANGHPQNLVVIIDISPTGSLVRVGPVKAQDPLILIALANTVVEAATQVLVDAGVIYTEPAKPAKKKAAKRKATKKLPPNLDGEVGNVGPKGVQGNPGIKGAG